MTALTDPSSQGYYSVSFSPRAKYYQLTNFGPSVPYDVVLSPSDPTFSLLLQSNQYLNETLQKFDLPSTVYGTIKVDNYTLNYREFRPPNFDGSGNTKYPVLFHCYGGPVSQTVAKVFDMDWHKWLSSDPELEYVIVEVDGRGTGFMGRKSRVGVHGQLGILEAYDQAAAAE
jgi:dipeptidyl aminopeptidase B